MSLLKDKLELGVEEAEFMAQQKLNAFPPYLKWLLAVIVVLILPSYFIAKNISYSSWKKNNARYELAAKPSFSQSQAPEISSIMLLSQGTGAYTALVTVTNKNLELSLPETEYQANFYNDKNEVVYTAGGRLFLLPDQSKSIVIPKFTASEKIVSAHLALPAELNWQKRASLPEVKLIAGQPAKSFQYDPLAFVAEGSVYNDSPYSLKQIRLIFVVYNIAGQPIAASQRDEFTLKPYERRAYKQLWPGFYANDIGLVTVAADINTLDSSNLDLPAASVTPSSDLNRPATKQ